MFFNLFALRLEGLCRNAKSAASILVVSIALFIPLLWSFLVACFAFWGCHLKPLAFRADQQVEVRA